MTDTEKIQKAYELLKSVMENQPKKEKKVVKVFNPPTFNDVQSYISNKKYNVDAENFIDFYSSKGWMVGKNKMKDWRASVRTWAKRDKRGEPVKSPTLGQDGREWKKVIDEAGKQKKWNGKFEMALREGDKL